MAQHEPEGSLLAIHSVCVAGAMRRRRVATRLLRAYLQFVLGTTPQLREVRCWGLGGRAGVAVSCGRHPGLCAVVVAMQAG